MKQIPTRRISMRSNNLSTVMLATVMLALVVGICGFLATAEHASVDSRDESGCESGEIV